VTISTQFFFVATPMTHDDSIASPVPAFVDTGTDVVDKNNTNGYPNRSHREHDEIVAARLIHFTARSPW
jgi:hypothetical protein